MAKEKGKGNLHATSGGKDSVALNLLQDLTEEELDLLQDLLYEFSKEKSDTLQSLQVKLEAIIGFLKE